MTKVLDAMEEAGIDVIIGTPTYAVPSWLVKMDPTVLAVTHQGEAYTEPVRSWTSRIRTI